MEDSKMPAEQKSCLSSCVAAPKKDDRRALGLDILRFVAVTLVVFRHLELLECPADADRFSRLVQTVSQALNTGGWVGVDIFFVLSGFLVSGLLFREWQQRNTISIGRFLIRRGLKIYPSFWFFLAVMLALTIYRHQAISLRGLTGELLFLQNCLGNLFNHTWSLAVEEHFYLLCAVGIWLLLRFRQKENPFRSIPKWFIFVAIACLVVRYVSNQVLPPGRVRLLFFGTHIRIDSLFFGVLLSYLWHFHFSDKVHLLIQRYRWFLVATGVALLLPMFFTPVLDPWPNWVRIYGFILCYLAGGALLLGFLKIFNGKVSLPFRALAFLGSSSYSAYLWHQFGMSFIASYFALRTVNAGSWLAYCVLGHASAWTLGIIAARIVEFPVLKLRDRWFPGKTSHALTN